MPFQTVSEIFVASLKDPHDPKFCGTYLVGCLHLIFPHRNIAAFSRTNLTGNFDVWNTLARFISTKRSTKQIKRLLTRLSACTCKISDPHIARIHDAGAARSKVLFKRNSGLLDYMDIGGVQKVPDDAISTTVGSVFPVEIFQFMTNALQNSSIKKTAKGSSSWPTSPTDLIPLGPDAFVEAVIQWYNTLKDGIVFSFLGVVFRLCRAVILPRLSSYAMCKYLVQCMRDTFDKVWYVWYQLEGKAPEGVDIRSGFLTQSEGIQSFLDVLKDQELDQKAAFVRGYETKLCQACNLFMSVLTDPRFPSTVSLDQIVLAFFPYAYWGQELYRLFHMHLGHLMNPPRSSMALHVVPIMLDEKSFPPPESIRDPSSGAVFAIKIFKADFRCCGKECTSSLQSEGKSFQKCSGCGVVGYCGKDCQLQDWRNTPYPHKSVCPILRKLVTAGGGPSMFPKEDFPQQIMKVLMAWSAAGIREDDMKFVDDWARDREKWWNVMPNGEEWEPGYDDYEYLIWRFKGPRPQYPNVLARWPSEVAKVKVLLQELPFFGSPI